MMCSNFCFSKKQQQLPHSKLHICLFNSDREVIYGVLACNVTYAVAFLFCYINSSFELVTKIKRIKKSPI